MNDTTQEERLQCQDSIFAKLDTLNPEEKKAVGLLCYAFRQEQDQAKIVRQKKAIEAMLGELSIGEWLVLGPTIDGMLQAMRQVEQKPKFSKRLKAALGGK